jgi:hypothetical protein
MPEEPEYTGLQAEAHEMALQLMDGNRDEVREFISQHATPAKLCLAIVRHLTGESTWHLTLDHVVNVQSLIEYLEV